MTSAELYKMRGIDDEIERVRGKIRKAKERAEIPEPGGRNEPHRR